MGEPKISFVILTWNSERYIESCINSILSDMEITAFTLEIFIVDNGSRDSTPDILKELEAKYFPMVVPIFLKKNYGTTVSRNLALKKVRGKYVCILDSDIQILPGLFMELVHTFSEKQTIGLVVPKLIYPNGKLQKSTDQFPTLLRKIFRYFFLKKLEEYEHQNTLSTEILSVDYAISALWFFKKSILDTVGFLDENIFYAPEDVDYCLRIWQSGKQVLYNPNACAIHHTQEISRGFRINKATIHHILGLGYLFLKHKYFLNKPDFSAL